jgi:hypothetical protein
VKECECVINAARVLPGCSDLLAWPSSSFTEKAGSEKSDPSWRSERRVGQRQPRRRQGHDAQRGRCRKRDEPVFLDGSLPRLTSGSRRAPSGTQELYRSRAGARARAPGHVGLFLLAAERGGGREQTDAGERTGGTGERKARGGEREGRRVKESSAGAGKS